MLEITIPEREYAYEDPETGDICFMSTPKTNLTLEHSLISVAKWEAKWKKPFLDDKVPKTHEESIDYVRCMTLNKSVDPLVYDAIDHETMKKITDYIDDSQTATWFSPQEKAQSKFTGKKITAELIYYWMSALNLPFDICSKWHLSRLMTLIEVCNLENAPKKNMTPAQIAKQNHSLNAARRKAHKTRG